MADNDPAVDEFGRIVERDEGSEDWGKDDHRKQSRATELWREQFSPFRR